MNDDSDPIIAPHLRDYWQAWHDGELPADAIVTYSREGDYAETPPCARQHPLDQHGHFGPRACLRPDGHPPLLPTAGLWSSMRSAVHHGPGTYSVEGWHALCQRALLAADEAERQYAEQVEKRAEAEAIVVRLVMYADEQRAMWSRETPALDEVLTGIPHEGGGDIGTPSRPVQS